MSKQLEFFYKKVSDLIPYVNNARTHSDEQVIKLASSIKEYGFIAPIVISEDGGVLAGHGRLLAAKKLGIEEVPCVVESHLTEIQKKGYILADNRLSLDAGWDDELLKIELQTLKDNDVDLALTGFDEEEINNLLGMNDNVVESTTKEDDPVKIDKDVEPTTKLGDLIILGEHRLICGDCTDKIVVNRLFGDDKPNLMVTDPPYGTNYEPRETGGRTGKVLNDDRDDWTDAYKLFPGTIAYIWHADLHSDVIFANLRSCGFTINSLIIWNKSQSVLGRGDYHWKHEPCVYATKGPHNWQGGRNQTTIWDIPVIRSLDEGEWGHGTQKPIECMKRPIENNTVPGEYVYDPFCGSGTTIIAAERTGRKCLACELNPIYCDAIIKRWEAETGRKAIIQE